MANIKQANTFKICYIKIKQHFNIKINQKQYYTDWMLITFKTIQLNPVNYGKLPYNLLNALFKKL